MESNLLCSRRPGLVFLLARRYHRTKKLEAFDTNSTALVDWMHCTRL